MAEKLIITTDGSLKNTTIKLDGVEMTKDYKVTSMYFRADGGYSYKSSYDNNTYTNPPSISYEITYLDGDKSKSISVATPRINTQFGVINKTEDSLSHIGIDNEDKVKIRLINDFDKLREKNSLIPNREVLEKRTIDSLIDKYVDCINELEIQSKK